MNYSGRGDILKGNRTHCKAGTRLYRIWTNMKNRCYNKHDIEKYKSYGGRGIRVCDEWKHNFMNFYNWAMNNNYRDDLTIDRIDNDGNYEPSNCRWIDIKVQCNNRRSNTYLTYQGKTQTMMQWSKELGVKYRTMLSRRIKGWSTEEILFGRKRNDTNR